MIRRTVRRMSRLKLSKAKTIALLVVLLAAVLEVYIHTSRYSVRVPEHDLDAPFYTSCQEPPDPDDKSRERANAALVMLVRNQELEGALETVASVERKFNRWFHYPIVFLNDEPWTDEFKTAMTAAVSGEARFEVIPPEEWTFPAWMDRDAARASIKSQGQWMIKFAGLETYHHMCRFYSGKFYTISALSQYKWYWRIEPGVEFYCDITYDPFLEMERRGKVYGHTIAVPEGPRTCPSLFRQMSDYKEAHGIEDTELWKTMVSPSWAPWPFRRLLGLLHWHRDRRGDTWSFCHYWSNFEIASLEFFRGKAYQDLFEYLDSTGGFYYERVSSEFWHTDNLGKQANGTLNGSGEMRRCIPWPWGCCWAKKRSIISRTWDIDMITGTSARQMLREGSCSSPRLSTAPLTRSVTMVSAAGASAMAARRGTGRVTVWLSSRRRR